jgi:hypothetical protein
MSSAPIRKALGPLLAAFAHVLPAGGALFSPTGEDFLPTDTVLKVSARDLEAIDVLFSPVARDWAENGALLKWIVALSKSFVRNLEMAGSFLASSRP